VDGGVQVSAVERQYGFEWEGEPSRFDTIPSAPSRQAWANASRPFAEMLAEPLVARRQ
jgi:hypothetical protein